MSKYLTKIDALLKRVSDKASTWLCVLSSDERAKSGQDIPGIDYLVVIETFEDDPDLQ